MNLKIAICDDEKTEKEYLIALVNQWLRSSAYTADISSFESAETFLFAYADDKSFDILLLDIQMKSMDGVELAKQIRKDNETVQIVFITGFPDFIAEGYEVSALHYLMKPVNETKLVDVLNKACKILNKTEHSILLYIGGESVRIPARDIIYAEVFAHLIVIQTTKDKFEVKLSITEAVRLFGEGFIRCHRSYIVGLKYVKRITKTDIILDNGKTIPLSRRLYTEVNKAFIKFFKGAN